MSSRALIINQRTDKLFEHNKQVKLKKGFITLVMACKKGRNSILRNGKFLIPMDYAFNLKFHEETLLLMSGEIHTFIVSSQFICIIMLAATGKYIDRRQTSFGEKLKYARYLSADSMCSHWPKSRVESSKAKMAKFEDYKSK